MPRRRMGIAFIVASCTAAAWAGPLPDGFVLAKYVPSGMWMFVNGLDNPERAQIDALWAPIISEISRSGLEEVLKNLIVESQEDPQARLDAGRKWDRVSAAVRSIPWHDMFRQEVAFAERLNPPVPDVLLLTRPAPASIEAVKLGMRNLFEAILALDGDMSLKDQDLNGVSVLTLGVAEGVFEVSFLAHGDVVGLILGRSALDDVTGLLTGTKQITPMARDARFLASIKDLPEPKDAVMYFDFRMLCDQLREYPKMIHKPTEGADSAMAGIQGMWLAGIDFFDCVEYSATCESSRKMQTLATTRVTLREDAMNKPLVRALTAGKPFDRVDQFVPQKALGFSVSSGIDIGILYQAARDFLINHVPNSAGAIKYWDDLLAEHDLDPARDLFSWLRPEIVSVALPNQGPGGEGVCFIRVSDPRLAGMKVNSGLDMIHSHMGPSGMTLRDAPEVDAKGFRIIQHAGLIPFGLMKPCVGVYEDWLAISTSPEAINACIATSKGDPGFTRNDRFQAEGLVPTGPVVGCSFTDMRNFGQELGGAFFAAGAAGGMALAQMPPDKTRVPRAMLDILSRVAQAMTRIDFMSSSATRTTFDGRSWHMEQQTTFRAPVRTTSSH